MSATITIPAGLFAGETRISLRLVDTHGRGFPGELLDGSGTAMRVLELVAQSSAATVFTIPCNDEFPATPAGGQSYWRVVVHDALQAPTYLVSISKEAPPSTWGEFLASGDLLDPEPPSAWVGRLPPDPSSEPDNRWLKTESGAYVFTNAPSNGGGGGGHVIEDDGTPMPQRTALNFRGALISDDAGSDATVVDVTITEIAGQSGF